MKNKWLPIVSFPCLRLENVMKSWRLDGSDAYFVKSGYRFLRDDHHDAASVTVLAYSNMIVIFFKDMWSVILPAKVKINMWRIANSFVPTYSIMQNRRLNVNNVCPLFLSSDESITHLMRDCSFVHQLFFVQGAIASDSARFIDEC
ncbi:hypothetical protein V6N11_084254 [Hibiscus sabdariffa]|uniref:Reverse transcriptase zinc-binding domain-containing protein n=1 Tax=Hibiscus sabdariffa TaxID=183260 RepID=A0ABR2QSG0_9ROSI